MPGIHFKSLRVPATLRQTLRCSATLLALFCPFVRTSYAEESNIERIASGLNDPRGVAVRPGGTPEKYEIFIAEAGRQRVIKILSNDPARPTDVITDFPIQNTPELVDARGENPLCMLFIDHDRLVVGVHGNPGEVRLYEVDDAAGAVSADQAKQRVTPTPPDGLPPGHLKRPIALARTRANDSVSDMLLVANYRLWRIPIRAGTLGGMALIDEINGSKGGPVQPIALTVSQQGYAVAADESARPRGAIMKFVNPATRQIVLHFPLGLAEVAGLAFSPKSGNLYAIGASLQTHDVGLFRIDEAIEAGKTGSKPVKIVNIEKPTSLAFAPDGALYVTTSEGNERGTLLRLGGDL